MVFGFLIPEEFSRYRVFFEEGIVVFRNYIEYVLEIGRIIHHDFTQDIPELRRNYQQTDNAPEVEEVKWKDKYINLLEEHQKLLERFLAIQEGR